MIKEIISIARVMVSTAALAPAKELHVGAGHPLKTIPAAAQPAQPGDTITVHAGVYRERVDPPRGGSSDTSRITSQAAPGEKVVIAGAEPPAGKAVRDRNIPFDRWDMNHDGSLSLEEFKPGLKTGENLEERFKRSDKNNDGKVSREELVGPSAKSPGDSSIGFHSTINF